MVSRVDVLSHPIDYGADNFVAIICIFFIMMHKTNMKTQTEIPFPLKCAGRLFGSNS